MVGQLSEWPILSRIVCHTPITRACLQFAICVAACPPDHTKRHKSCVSIGNITSPPVPNSITLARSMKTIRFSSLDFPGRMTLQHVGLRSQLPLCSKRALSILNTERNTHSFTPSRKTSGIPLQRGFSAAFSKVCTTQGWWNTPLPFMEFPML